MIEFNNDIFAAFLPKIQRTVDQIDLSKVKDSLF